MSRIKNKFLSLFKKKEKALIAYMMTGYPNEKFTLPIVRSLIKGGADMIEIGYPFSDPLADGPLIQNAGKIALQKKININKLFSIIKKIRSETNIPLILMTYTNILYKYGYDDFISIVKDAGVDGIILPDMSIDESDKYIIATKSNNMDTIFLAAPNTTNMRIKKIGDLCTGFLYLVTTYGTTGTKIKIQRNIKKYIKNTKSIINIPVGTGFGIYTPNDVEMFISSGADAVIIGSAFFKIIENTPLNNILSRIVEFTHNLKIKTK